MNNKTDNNKFSNLIFFLFLAFTFLPAILGRFAVPIIFAIIVALGFIYLKNKSNVFSFVKQQNQNIIDINKLKNMENVKKFFLSFFSVVFSLWLFFASIVIVDAGEVGVYSLFGKVSDQELKSGFHLVIPLARVTKMSTRTEEYTMSIVSTEGRKLGDDSISALTKEGLTISLDLTALYHIEEDKASDIYKNVGLTYDEKIIRPVIRTAIRDVIAGYDAKDIYSTKRSEVTAQIKENIQGELSSRSVVLEELLLRDARLPENLTKSIQEKLQAEQESQKYDFLLEKEKKEKQRKIIEAEGQRDSQKIINESLSTNYLYYQYISSLKDRQGTIYVPTSPDTGMPLFRNLGE